jgi:ribosome-binding protein aMBF1 (putative translation factor)
MFDAIGQCLICKREYTSMHIEYKPGTIIYVCPNCMKKTRDHFIWLCMNCGKSYFRPREAVISRLEANGMEKAALLRDRMQLILGIDMCIECNPEGILEFVYGEETAETEAVVCAK